MARRAKHLINNVADLLAYEEELDRSICGLPLTEERDSDFELEGAHGIAPSHYFVLDELFGHLSFDSDSHLLDVGCSTGRVLAYFLKEHLPGKATGIELDPECAAIAQSWTSRYDNLRVIQGNALEIDLTPYTDFYMFNPFSPTVLQKFISTIEWQIDRPCNLIHMSDNGDTWQYVGRPGWTEIASGEITALRNDRGFKILVYDYAQHYTIWHYDGSILRFANELE